VGGLFDSDGRKENRNLFAVRLLFTETVSRVFFMTQATAERTTQAQAQIQEITALIAGVQALISAGVESPWCDNLTQKELGKAYHYLAEMLSKVVLDFRLFC
jgi:hypothetical protein